MGDPDETSADELTIEQLEADALQKAELTSGDWVRATELATYWKGRAEAAEAREAALREALISLESEGWFAAWSDDPRVTAIRAALANTAREEA